MSTILKALRRLESDKNSQVQRPLRQEVAGGSEARRRFPVLWVAAGVFVAGLAIGAAALFLWPADFLGSGTQEPAAAPPAVAAADVPAPQASAGPPARDRERQRPARPPRPAPARKAAAAAAPAAPAARTVEQDVAVVGSLAPTPLRVQEGSGGPTPHPPRPGEVRPGAEAMRPKHPAPKPTQVAAAAPQPAEPAAPPKPAAPAATPVTRPAPPEPKPSVSLAPEPEEEAEVEPEPAPPPEAELPVRRRAGVPVILVSRTQWHPRPERREALIEVETADGSETRRVHEGDSVGSLVVERIEPSGVVFDYDGVELRHAVGSGP